MQAPRGSWRVLLPSALAAVLVATACGEGGAGGGGGGGPLEVGLAAPYVGEKGFLGPNLQKGVEVAIDEINGAGGPGGGPVKLVTGDTEGTAQGAISAIQKLLEQDDVDALIGPTSVTVLTVLNRIQASGVPAMIIASTSALDGTIKGETTFRATPSDTLIGPAMAQAAIDRGTTRCAVVAESLEGAQSTKANVTAAFQELGGEISRTVDVAIGQSSYRSEILKLVGDPVPECAFVEVSPESASQFWQDASQFDEVGQMLWVGNDVILNEDSIEALSPVSEELELIAISPAAIGPGRDDYVAAYQAKFPNANEPVILSDLGWDAMNIVALAAYAAESAEHEAIAGEIQNVSRDGEACTTYGQCKSLLDEGTDIDYEGASGSADIDDTGNSVSGFGIFEIRDGKVEEAGQISEEQVKEILDQIGL
jgi:branched-chain amino acid transport system substrate-binding protein